MLYLMNRSNKKLKKKFIIIKGKQMNIDEPFYETFIEFLVSRASDNIEQIRRKLIDKKNKKIFDDFVSKIFANYENEHQSIQDILTNFFSDSLNDTERFNIITNIIYAAIFGDEFIQGFGYYDKKIYSNEISKNWQIARFASFIFSTKRFGYNFFVQFIHSLCIILNKNINQIDKIFCGEDSVFNQVIRSVENKQKISDEHISILNIFHCSALIFPHIYDQSSQLTSEFFKLDKGKVFPNDLVLFGMSINYVINQLKIFGTTQCTLPIFSSSVSQLCLEQSSIESLSFYSVKNVIDREKEEKTQIIEENLLLKNKLKQSIADFNTLKDYVKKIQERNLEFIEKKNEFEKLRGDYSRALATIEHLREMVLKEPSTIELDDTWLKII